jgi:hypothetical protein
VSQTPNGPAGDDQHGQVVAMVSYERCVALARELAERVEKGAVAHSVMLGVHGPDEPDVRRVELDLKDQADMVFWLARVALERLARRGADVQEVFRAASSELREEDPRRLGEFERGMGPVVGDRAQRGARPGACGERRARRAVRGGPRPGQGRPRLIQQQRDPRRGRGPGGGVDAREMHRFGRCSLRWCRRVHE